MDKVFFKITICVIFISLLSIPSYCNDSYINYSITRDGFTAWEFHYLILSEWSVNDANEIKNEHNIIIGQFETYKYNYTDTNNLLENCMDDYHALSNAVYSRKIKSDNITEYTVIQTRKNLDGKEFYRIACRDESGTYMILYELYSDSLSYDEIVELSGKFYISYDRKKDIERPYTDILGNKIGSVVGNIYATDIIAYIDDYPINSYSLNGRTAIIVEDLEAYGFNVKWDAGRRTLTVNTVESPKILNKDHNIKSNKPNGTIIGNIYATDIKTYINGKFLESYNIGGKTIVVIEDFTKDSEDIYRVNSHPRMYGGYSYYGFKTIWDANARTIKLTCLRPDDFLEITTGSYKIINKHIIPERYHWKYYDFKTSDGKIIQNQNTFCKNENTYILSEDCFVPMQVLFEMLQLEYEMYDNIINIISNSYKSLTFEGGASIGNTHTSEGILLEVDLRIAIDGEVVLTPDDMEIAYCYFQSTDILFINIRAFEEVLNTKICTEDLY